MVLRQRSISTHIYTIIWPTREQPDVHMKRTVPPIDVLCVDDDPDFVELVATFLEREDDAIKVRTTTSPADGLDLLERFDIDCVVSDYDMSTMDGLEFLEAVREEYEELPFILFTGKGSEEIASEAISAGVTDYLQKGGGSDRYAVLANRIENAVEGHRSRKKLTESRRRLSMFFEQSPLGVIEWNEQFELVRMNPAAEEILGYDSETVEGWSWEPFVPEPEIEAVADIIDEILDDRGGYHSINENVRSDGESIVCEWHNRVITDADDEVIAVFSQFQDVTDRVEERRRLEALIDNVPGIVYRHREAAGWPIEFVRGACEELTGYTAEELESTVHLAEDIIHPDDREYVRVNGAVEPDSTEQYDLVYRIVRKDDTERWVWERGGLVDVPGVDDHVVEGFLIDITELKRQQLALEETNAVVSTLLEALPIGVLVEDAQREIRAVNPSFCALFRLSEEPEELVGRDCRAVLETCTDQFENPTAQTDRIEAVLDRRDPVRDELVEFSDGRSIARTYIPYELPDGEANLWLYRDVTDRRRREQELTRESENLEALHAATTRLYAADSIEACYRITIDAAVTTLGFDWCTIAGPADDEELFEIWAVSDGAPLEVGDRPFGLDEGLAGEVYQQKTSRVVDDVGGESQAKPTDDTIRSALTVPVGDRRIFQAVATTAGAFDDRDRRHAELLVAAMVTAIERIEQQKALRTNRDKLKERNERLEAFARIISHDLQNPLNVAQGRLAMATAGSENEDLAAVKRAHDRMEALIDDLLELARSDAGVGDLEPIDLERIVDACWENVETGAETIRIDIDRRILADERRLKQLLENLIANAIEHGGTDVSIAIGELDDGFYIEDDGRGIPEDEHNRVFEAGYSGSSEGTGFGLSIVRRIAETHGWQVDLTESDAGGARFEITGVEFANPH